MWAARRFLLVLLAVRPSDLALKRSFCGLQSLQSVHQFAHRLVLGFIVSSTLLARTDEVIE